MRGGEGWEVLLAPRSSGGKSKFAPHATATQSPEQTAIKRAGTFEGFRGRPPPLVGPPDLGLLLTCLLCLESWAYGGAKPDLCAEFGPLT